MGLDPALVRLDFGQGESDQGLFDKAAAIRTEVFQVEQGYETEFDELDKDSAIHFIAELPASTAQIYTTDVPNGEFYAIAAGRIYQMLYKPEGDGKPDRPTYPLEMVFSLGRVCCRKPFRGQGIGRLILNKMMDTAQRLGADRLILHSQADKVEFYIKSGFVVIQHAGNDWCFDEDGQPHVGMQFICDNA